MTITEKNKLIAEFMGLDVLYGEYVHHGKTPKIKYKELTVTKMKYRSDPKWLIPVLQRLYSIYDNEQLSKESFEAMHLIYLDMRKPAISGDTVGVYECVVRLIEWYNKQIDIT